MNEYKKEYIECRLILIGDKKVGKKSFIKRILNSPSTITIHNTENENCYKKQIFKIRKQYEKEKKEKFEEINRKMANSDTKYKGKEDNKGSELSNINIKSISKSQEKKFCELEKNDYIMQITSKELFFYKDYIRPPIPEHPSKLFNIHNSKICIKPYFILPAEKVSNELYINEEESENDYEIDYELNLSFKGIKNDIYRIINNKNTVIEEDKLYGYKISIYNIFLFIYDMSEFNTFEILMNYFYLIEETFNISNLNNSIAYIIGNKNDKKIILDSEKQKTFNDFLKKNNLQFFEISTKPYFKFDKFLMDFLLNFLNKYHEILYNEKYFKTDLEKIFSNKSSFSKSIREIYYKKDSYPGPNYDINIYSFSSRKELKEALNNNKGRFNKKIYYNKIGPKYRSKSLKSINNNNYDSLKFKKSLVIPQLKGCVLLNKPIKGYTFGINKGNLDLLKSRKLLFIKRNENLKKTIVGDSSLFKNNLDSSRIKGEEYFEEVTERRIKLFEQKEFERKRMLEKIYKIHSNNLKKIEKKQEKNKKINFLSQYAKSLSTPQLFSSNNNSFSNKTQREIDRKKFLEVIFPKNKEKLKIFSKKFKKIQKNKREYMTPAPNAYDIRNNYTDNNKGPTIAGKRKELLIYKEDPSFPDLKDEFDIIVEKGNKTSRKQYKQRFKEIKKENNIGSYIDKEIWKKWEKNKLKNEKRGRLKQFFQYLGQRKKQQLMNIEEIKEQKNEIRKIKREILIRKGYEDPDKIRAINYSLIEESSPKYTIKGKNSLVFSTNNKNDISNFIKRQTEMTELINKYELNTPLPNINAVKPRLPRTIFSKAERFSDKKKEYESCLDLFKDGVFGLKTQENFSSKQSYSYREKRELLYYNNYQKSHKSPSPAEYKIKSSFEIIAENGQKISEIRDKIKKKENIIKYNINKKIEKKKKIELDIEKKNEEINKNDINLNNIDANNNIN